VDPGNRGRHYPQAAIQRHAVIASISAISAALSAH
jgi:hypothetical protein